MLQVTLTYLLIFALAWPVGQYLARLLRGGRTFSDRIYGPIERPIMALLGVNPERGMSLSGYVKAFLWSHLALGIFALLVFMFQNLLPFNPDAIPGMRWDVALHTSISFLTNTNQQHYSGQAQLSYFSQLAGIVGLQIFTPAAGIAVLAAVLRGMFGGRSKVPEGSNADLGNFYSDTLKVMLRVMVPLCLALSLLFTSQGVPATWSGAIKAVPLDQSAGMAEQVIPLGPVAPMIATKQLGTNGGGWYGPNSAVPLENPTPISNLAQVAAIVLLPVACVFMLTGFTGRRRLTALVFGSMAILSVSLTALNVWSERGANAATTGLATEVGMQRGNMEGKEQRFGTDSSALWASFTTQSSNGSVNAMHDSLNPWAGVGTQTGMIMNLVWGGAGCGLIGFLVYLWLSVFLAGLMVGRTPELYGRKLAIADMRWLSMIVVAQPLFVLTATAIALGFPEYTGNSNPGMHGLAQVFYEYTSAYANNGSGFEGLGDGTPFWNISTSILLLAGRLIALLVPLLIAARLAEKRVAPVSAGTLNIETFSFAFALLSVIVLVNLLCFLPALALGSLGEALSLQALPGR